jgi:hypothetical protein
MLSQKKLLIIAAVTLAVIIVIYFMYFRGNNTSYNNVDQSPGPKMVDPGMYDLPDGNAFGTTAEADRRWENASVRKEFSQNPFPLAEGCATGCDKKGVPNPAPGDVHGCKCGPPSKRMIDAAGGNHMIPHMCAPCTGESEEPSQLGRWWKNNQCSDPASVGLDMRPMCTRCGN